MRTFGTAILVGALAFAGVPAADAVIIPGGGKAKSDCYVGADITASSPILAQTSKSITAGACNRTCTFTVSSCVGLSEPATCTATALSGITSNPAVPNPSTLGPENACGEPTTVTVTIPGTRKKKKAGKVRLVGTAASAKPRKDPDNIKLICQETGNQGCDGSQGCPTACSNPDGGPNRLVLTIGTSGTDLDNGWSGNSHNFPLVPNGKLDMCLTGCNDADDTTCDTCGAIGAGTPTGEIFGAPLPLFASNVPVCVVSRWREEVTGTADVATGEMSLNVGLSSEVYLTDKNSVCPQCRNNQCNSGRRAGQPCTVQATLPVYVSSTQTDQYQLSNECLPAAPTATLRIDFKPLTSGTSGALNGPTPCTAQQGEPRGVPPQADSCAGSGCGSQCTGLACVTMAPDPTNPGSQVCIDSKGGLSQVCCNNNTQRPCFPRDGSGNLTRTGQANVPQPPLPDTTYPKTNPGVLASTFCIPATGTTTIDSVTGLPGPGTILLNGTAEWTK